MSQNRISALRLLVYVQNLHNNHLHNNQFDSIRNNLNISDNTIRKNLRVLVKLGVCVKYADGYWRFNSWKSYAHAAKNRIVSISISELRDLKFLRTLYYALKIKSGVFTSKKNLLKLTKVKKSRSKGFYPTSSSFVKCVTGIISSTSTISRHLKRSRSFRLLEYMQDKQLLAKFLTHEEASRYIRDINYIGYIRKIGEGFRVYKKTPNLVRSLITRDRVTPSIYTLLNANQTSV